ncbi:MAG: NACHT domain-containing protein [Saprospiraceae bacterium]
MKSPFKFLDAYTADDRNQFWGREEEIDALYGMVAQNRLILVYGQSGTGKTSLVQCGLASRFDSTDWLPLFVRRQGDLNRSLDARLAQALGQPGIESPAAALESLYETFLRPPYLIFDQLEEVFVLGSLEEQQQFANTIRGLLHASVPCRILFIIREEYLAQLYATERTLPTLFDRRLRVEPMSAAKVRGVLTSSFERFNIAVQPPAEDTLGQIIDNISGGKAGIQLPYLQVYLDTLYREDFVRNYPNAMPGEGGTWQPVEFTREEVKAVGKIENVLERFLREQQERLQKELEAKFGSATAEDAVRKVLDTFVSDEGTKRPIGYEQKGETLVLDRAAATLFEPLQAELVAYVCRALEQARLLRFDDHHIELAHDALAHLIDNQRTTEQRRLRDALNRLQSSYREHGESGEYLTRRQLNSLEDVLPILATRLSAEMKDFVEKSRARALELEQAELAEERRKRRQARRVAIIGFALATLATLAFFLALQQYRNAARNAAEAYRNVAIALKVEGKYTEALAQLEEVDKFSNVLNASEKTATQQLRTDWLQVRQLVASGDSLAHLEEFRLAGERYQAAQRIAPDAHLEALAAQAQKDLEAAFRQNMLNGETQMLAHRYDLAAASFEKALQLKPGDAAAERKLAEARGR